MCNYYSICNKGIVGNEKLEMLKENFIVVLMKSSYNRRDMTDGKEFISG